MHRGSRRVLALVTAVQLRCSRNGCAHQGVQEMGMQPHPQLHQPTPQPCLVRSQQQHLLQAAAWARPRTVFLPCFHPSCS
jgi:hypothetical protein